MLLDRLYRYHCITRSSPVTNSNTSIRRSSKSAIVPAVFRSYRPIQARD